MSCEGSVEWVRFSVCVGYSRLHTRELSGCCNINVGYSAFEQARLYDRVIDHASPVRTHTRSLSAFGGAEIDLTHKPDSATHVSNTAEHHSPPTLLYSAAVASR